MSNQKESVKRELFAANYRKYFPLVFNVVYGKIGDTHDAGDICQEIFMLYFHKLEEVRNCRTWLLGTIRYSIINFYRKKGRKEVDIESIVDETAFSYMNGFKDTRIMLEEAIENVDLNEEERLVFEYVNINSYSFKRVSQILSLPYHKVIYINKQIVRRIVAYLKKRGIKEMKDLL